MRYYRFVYEFPVPALGFVAVMSAVGSKVIVVIVEVAGVGEGDVCSSGNFR